MLKKLGGDSEMWLTFGFFFWTTLFIAPVGDLSSCLTCRLAKNAYIVAKKDSHGPATRHPDPRKARYARDHQRRSGCARPNVCQPVSCLADHRCRGLHAPRRHGQANLGALEERTDRSD